MPVKPLFALLLSIHLGATCTNAQDGKTIVIADFEQADYGNWKASGTAFGAGPARGTLPGQMEVTGFEGKGLVNSFLGGDDATGKLVSPIFTIERNYITFLIGGGGWPEETCMNLIADGKIVRTVTGSNTDSGGNERLAHFAWDVSELANRRAHIEIVDSRRGGWGHINVDQIVQTNEPGDVPIAAPTEPIMRDVSRCFTANKRWLVFPVKNGAKQRQVSIQIDRQPLHQFSIELADQQADWWAPVNVEQFTGMNINIVVDKLPESSRALGQISQTDEFPSIDSIYREPLRSQFHFSPMLGWMNDPNGLVFYQGKYHLFFQHNPYGAQWGNMHWGHATSTDLVHWTQHDEALYPDGSGTMFSGSAVVDWQNTSGFGQANQPPMVLFYTAAGKQFTQGLALSLDGKTFVKYDKNPILNQITHGNRDPKVFWHEPSNRWIMVLYVETAGKQHTIQFFTSKNLIDWDYASTFNGGIDGDKFLYECPDLFELPVDGNPSDKKWVLTAANSQFAVGSFDGKRFIAEESRLDDVQGRGFYAAQTFSDLPDGRRVQIGWVQAPSPNMPFNQLQSIPSELTLKYGPKGIRLHRRPIQELQLLRDGENQADSVDQYRSELIEYHATYQLGDSPGFEFELRGGRFAYDADAQQLRFQNNVINIPAENRKVQLSIYVDRTLTEVFANNGAVYATIPWIPDASDLSVQMPSAESVTTESFELYRLKSIWQ